MSVAQESAPAGEVVRKKLKASELPLSSVTRGAIEDLAHKFKKKGNYDSLRKQVWKEFKGSVSRNHSGHAKSIWTPLM
jgi:hypothetical protein